MRRGPRAAITLALIALASSAHALTFTCEGIAKKGGLDPTSADFSGQFGDKRRGAAAINGAGDVTFFASPKFAPKRLYLYPAVGAPSILTEANAAAPGGSTFQRFERPSINDAGDVAFFSKLGTGDGLFLKPAAGALLQVARTGMAAPGGSTFTRFPGLARINAGGDVVFLADLANNTRAVFRRDGATTLLSAVAREGDVATDGRAICDFIAPSVGLGDAHAVFQVITSVDCLSPIQSKKIGVYRETGSGIARVALAGDPTPIGGTTFGTFYGDPDANASDQVLIRANANGPPLVNGIFLFDPVSAAATLIGTGGALPGGGVVRALSEPHLTDGGRAAVRVSVNAGPTRDGIYLFGTTNEPVVRALDPVPTNLFPSGGTYRKIFEDIGVDRSGTHVTYTANVYQPGVGTRLALFRCAGS